MRMRRTPREGLLVGGLDDWTDASWVYASALATGEADRAVLTALTFDLIADMLRAGLMIPGDIVDGKHLPWQGEPGEWLERIKREWRDEWGQGIPTPGAIVWLDNTPAGDAIARAVLTREADQ